MTVLCGGEGRWRPLRLVPDLSSGEPTGPPAPTMGQEVVMSTSEPEPQSRAQQCLATIVAALQGSDLPVDYAAERTVASVSSPIS